ncbi:MAG: DVUA0089 family protein [Phycisphaerales bacterium]
MSSKLLSAALLLTAASLTTSALAGPDWIEDGDAGSTLGAAQDITPVGVINSIAGTLGGQDTEDVYKLVILNGDDIASPVDFGFTNNGGPQDFNPSLWLFDSEGFGVLGNDDDPILGGPDARLLTPSTDGVTLLLPPGTYFIAITESGNVPLSFRENPLLGEGGSFEEIFSFESVTEVSGPDGLGADNPLAAWTGGAGSEGGYGIVITPTPSSAFALALAGLGMSRRRRN